MTSNTSRTSRNFWIGTVEVVSRASCKNHPALVFLDKLKRLEPASIEKKTTKHFRKLSFQPWGLLVSEFSSFRRSALPKTNIAPENRPSQKNNSIPTIHFQVLLLLVSERVYQLKRVFFRDYQVQFVKIWFGILQGVVKKGPWGIPNPLWFPMVQHSFLRTLPSRSLTKIAPEKLPKPTPIGKHPSSNLHFSGASC